MQAKIVDNPWQWSDKQKPKGGNVKMNKMCVRLHASMSKSLGDENLRQHIITIYFDIWAHTLGLKWGYYTHKYPQIFLLCSE